MRKNRSINRHHTINKGKLTVSVLALSGALSAMASLHAQTITGTVSQVTLTSADMSISSTAVISGSSTGITTNGTTLGTLTNSGTVSATHLGLYNNGHTIAAVINTSIGNISASNSSAVAIYNTGTIGTLINSGSITSTGNYGAAVSNRGQISVLDNSGLISVSGDSVSAIYNSGGIALLTNSGTLTTSAGSNNAITNYGSIGTLNNSGLINSGINGIGNYTNGSIISTITLLVNASSGTISAGSSGIANNGGLISTLSNSGHIIGTSGPGIYNSGQITELSNDGTITGLAGIANYGTIGTLGNSGFIHGTSSSGINNTSLITGLSNDGTITGNTLGIFNTGTISTLTNSGSISGAYQGIKNAGSITSLLNDTGGNISGSSAILNLNSNNHIATLTNNGTLNGGNTGVFNVGTITLLDNSGSINGTNNAGIVNNGLISTLTNNASGIITGYWGVSNGSNSTISALTNSGSISGTTFAINNDGLISALTNNASGTLSSGTAINNSGTIGTLINNGLISGSYTGIYSTGTISTLTNNGLISSTINAINVAGGTLVNFTNTGTVAGTLLNQTSNALTINGGSGTIFGTLTGYGGGISSTYIGSIISAGDITFGSGNQLLNDDISVNSGSGTVTNAGVLQLVNPVTITGNYVQDASASLLIGVTGSATFNGNLTDIGYGRLVVNGSAVIAAGSSITLQSLGYSFAQGQRYVVVAAYASGTNYNASSLVYSAAGYTVTASVQTDTGNSAYSDLVLTLGGGSSGNSGSSGDSASTTPINNATTSTATAALGGLLKYSGTDAAMLAVFNPATTLSTPASANRAGAELNPAAISNATAQAVNTANQAVANVVASHLDSFHIAQNGSSGVATGERASDIALWGQVFGGRASQGLRDNISGYHANYRGLLIGADGLVSDALRVGGLVSAAKTNLANDDDNTGSSADINNTGMTAYATYTGKPWYVNVMAGASRQQYSTVRSISYSTFSGTANGSFNGSQYQGSLQAGYPLNLDAWLPGATLTPVAGLSYSTLRQNGYTESGGNGAALVVKSASTNSLKSELGVKLERGFDVSYGKLLPSVQLGWRHEYKDDAMQSGASFAADSTGSTAFVTHSATPVANTGVLNLGLTLVQSKNLSLSGKYTLETGSGYLAQTGSVQVRWQY